MPRLRLTICLSLVLGGASCVGPLHGTARADGVAASKDLLSFNRDVRPILSDSCFHCHGPDSGSRAADLRLDVRQDAIDYGAIAPGEPSESLLVERILETDADLVMPPPSSHRSLTEEQKKTLSDWIAQGAAYQRHWSLEPVRADDDLHDSLDAFVSEALAEKRLQPSRPASRELWLRRVTLDLTGLPPDIEDVDAFLADKTTKAYERVVDRLLASPAYGERMAAEWLDVARYSDTYGYQVDRDRFVWPWRDWVIRAFNSNLPYDAFITQQIAGDMLPNATDDQILATTFCRLHPQKVEGGSVEEEFRVEYVVDRVQTVGTAFLGLTLECARCHDHKFDPIAQQEFYELNAFFANINESGLYSYHTASVPTPTLRLPEDPQRRQLAQREKIVAAAEEKLLAAKAAVREVRAEEASAAITRVQTDFATAQALEVESKPTHGPDDVEPKPEPDAAESAAPETKKKAATPNRLPAETCFGPVASCGFEEQPSGAELVEGVVGHAVQLNGDSGVSVGPAVFRRWEPFSVALWMQTPDVKQRAVVYHHSLGWTDAASRGYQLLIEEGKLSAALIHFWPGNAICVRTTEPITTQKWMHVVVTYDGSSRAAGLRISINGQPAECQVVQDNLTKEIAAGKTKNIVLGQRTRDRGFTNGLVDAFEVYDRELTSVEIAMRSRNEPLESLGAVERLSELSATQVSELAAQHLSDAVKVARDDLQLARTERDKLLDQIQEIMVMRELPELRETYLLRRGVYDQRAERVHPDTLSALPALPEGASKNRLGLAEWLTMRSHPLTARVAVNRYWQLLFGRGIVATSEDFGSQGSPPTHPELLDWLANRFVESGWDVKQLLKTMVLSDAYRRDSAGVDGSEQKDPENLWLARGPAAPLTAEMIRDSALASSGLLSRRIGGEPARPYELALSYKPVEHDTGEGLYRRSLYTYWKRTAPAPVMLVLDAPTRDVCRVKRERTSSPLKSLALMNGPQHVEAARGIALRVLRDVDQAAPVRQRLERLFRMLTSRTPQASELAVLERLYKDRRDAFEADPESAHQYLAVGEMALPEDVAHVDLAALAIVAQTVANLDDCLVKR